MLIRCGLPARYGWAVAGCLCRRPRGISTICESRPRKRCRIPWRPFLRMRERRSRITQISVVSMLAVCAFVRIAPAQETGATTLRMYSRLTVVDVTATDADGQAVFGLKQSDFTILEDGKPQPIRNFEEVGLRPAMPVREMPPNVYTNLQPPAPSSAVNILLLDFANEAPVDSTEPGQVSASAAMQHQVKQAAIQALQTMPEGTRDRK